MSKKVAIIFPCLNESKTLKKCVDDAKRVMGKSKYKNDFEILVCDNGSTDNSVEICKKHKIKYLVEKKHGYGNALMAGIKKSSSKYIVMLDCDLSYDTKDIPTIIDELEKGNDVVIGNRFKGEIGAGAMPLSHRIGSRLLTEYANLLFHTKAHDLHCGLRGFDRKKILALGLQSSGFEFASEMMITAKKRKLKITEIKTNLYKDGRDRKPHLRAIRDGLRHFYIINKKKFELSKPFRYVTTFILSIAVLFALTVCSALIPRDLVKDNAIKSVQEINASFSAEDEDQRYVPEYRRFERHGDIRNFAMAVQTDNTNPVASAIEMNYLSFCDHITICDLVIETGRGGVVEYSRYWQGQSVAIHFALVFTSANTIILIATILFAILFVIVTYKLFKEDKILAVAFVLASLSINLPFVTRSLQYLPIMFVMLIVILLVLHSRKHDSKNLDIIFLLSGVLTCYFDFLTSETLSLTIPLLIYVYLECKNKDENSTKKIIQMFALWGVGYAGGFATKWFINYLHFGWDFFEHDMNYLFNHTMGITKSSSILTTISNNFIPILPFALIPNGTLIFFGIFIICIFYTIFVEHKKLPLLLICLVPLLRFSIIRSHSYILYYFAYRAVMPIVMFIIITIATMIKKSFSKTDDDII